jgi:hypothetical protein
MGIGCAWCVALLFLALFLIPFPILVTAQPYGYLTVSSSSSWTNNFSAPDSVQFDDGSIVRIILVSDSYDYGQYACGCGFFYNQTYNSSLFAIFTVDYEEGNISKSVPPEVVWSANPNNPVSVNATLQLTSERGLVLQDANGTIAWSTNITNKSVAALNLTDTCNLMLLDENNATIWQSLDVHPTDTLIVGQMLVAGQNLTSEGGLYSLSLTSDGLFAYINSNPPQQYFSKPAYDIKYVQFQNGSLVFFPFDSVFNDEYQLPNPSVLSSQYMRFGLDGHLRMYDGNWVEVYDVFKEYIDYCSYPTACGNYGICLNDQCSCLGPKNGTSYFQPINDRVLNLGCSPVTPLSCEASKYHILLEVENITYFPFQEYSPDINPDHQNINLESCKKACLNNCSCKAAFYNSSNNCSCYLQSQIFSLIAIDNQNINLKVYIKVQNVQSAAPPLQQTNHGKKKHEVIIGSVLSSFLALSLLIGIFVSLFLKKENADEDEEYYLDQVPGMPTRYSYHDLQAMTENFKKELGGGGFGTVFEGTLIVGTKVAVKRLHGFSQIKKSFLAEVETIGSLHHFNLVRLVGFCAEKSHRLLIYEYMSNGSLDRWVFDKNPEILLDWQHRKKIILDIARGLTYLHEDCRQKIVHLDIKPQNILLDENFNAKVSDFGLSKLVDRDQSQVVTIMRGTPGYMAPEWLSSVITEKVDVYSFGIVLLEILCGRKNFDRAQPEESMHLLHLLKKKIEEDRLLDLVDNYSEDMQLHGAEVVNMMRVAARCLQNDYTKRPSMSMVVKVLEDVVNIESDIDYFFWNPPLPNMGAGIDNQEMHLPSATSLLPSILSGPR